MIRSLIHKIVANPFVYDLVQFLTGAEITNKRIKLRLAKVDAAVIVDIGGGTGSMMDLFPKQALYICLDIDEQKLEGYRAKYPNKPAVLGDATTAPIATASVDLVVCKFLSHHIPDDRVDYLLRECYRILRPTGTLLFVESLRNDRRFRSRFLWKYDRGSFPRTGAEVRQLVEKNGVIAYAEEFEFAHQHIILEARPQSL